MKNYLFLLAMILFAVPLFAQVPYNSAVPNGYTKKATVSEQVGLTQVMITYHRPSVKGREGKIWGEIVHKGFVDQGFGNGNPAPWRAGANENTIIEFDNDVKIEGQTLPKGKYGLFVAYDPLESIVIFSKKSDAWGSFFYDEKEDALRVKVKPQPIEKSVENLKYEFSNQTPNSAVVMTRVGKTVNPFQNRSRLFETATRRFRRRIAKPAQLYFAKLEHRRRLDFAERLRTGKRTRMGDAGDKSAVSRRPDFVSRALDQSGNSRQTRQTGRGGGSYQKRVAVRQCWTTSAIRQTTFNCQEAASCNGGFSV